ncbi:MAG: ribonuclease HI family protein [Armatimonadetes bacterium]|nr:ribonuclease HI family protein [Armatimonadota bacterium]
MLLRIYADGSSIGNPGPAGVGVVVFDESGKILVTHSLSLPFATNNEAEYIAVIEALKLAQKFAPDEVILFVDSELVAQQLKGKYKVKSPKLQRLHEEVLSLARKFRRFSVTYIPRESNSLANKLAQEASSAASSLSL